MPAVFLVLTAAALLAFARMLRGPSRPDRVVAFDLLTVITIGLLGTASVAYDRPVLIDAAIVLALVSFLTTVALANVIGRADAPREDAP